jgi:hypothetical protein
MALNIQFRQRTSTRAAHPTIDVPFPPGFKILGGGASVEVIEPGNLLTACFPVNPTTWRASAKDHELSSPASVTGFAYALFDPENDYQVFVQQEISDPAAHPGAIATLPSGFVLTGGGASVQFFGAGSLLTATFPNTATSWEARAKDHDISDPSRITAFAIGIRPNKPNIPPVFHSIPRLIGEVRAHPTARVCLDPQFTLCGGGAFDQWQGDGNLLTGSFPTTTDPGNRCWDARGKDHIHPSPAAIEVFAIGVRT